MFEFTREIYWKMVDSAIKYESHWWDCIELENGMAVTFAMDKMKPYDVEVFDEDDNVIPNNFNISQYFFWLKDSYGIDIA